MPQTPDAAQPTSSPRDGFAYEFRALVALGTNDVEGAVVAVEGLIAHDEFGIGGVMHDWTVACRQRHGAAREAQCFDHLRVALTRAAAHDQRAHLVLGFATKVLARRTAA